MPQSNSHIIGYRGFSVVRDVDTARHMYLSGSAWSSMQWSPGVNTARCLRSESYADFAKNSKDWSFPQFLSWAMNAGQYGAHHQEDTPVEDCTCGFWFLCDLEAAICRADPVVGAIQGWGRVVEHEDGWRCEKAQVIALLVRPETDMFEDVVTFKGPIPRALVVRRLAEKYVRRLGEIYDVPVFETNVSMQAFVENYGK